MSAPIVGVSAAVSSQTPSRTIFNQFTLTNKVALVTGGQRGIGLEVALGFAEAGAIVYCLDISKEPDSDFGAAKKYAAALPDLAPGKKGRLEYVSGDVTNQKQMWKIAEDIVAKEGRLDICFANAGMLAGAGSLEYSGDEFNKLMNVNVNGVLYTAQAAGRQMEKLGIRGSIILTASISGHVANIGHHWVAYNTSKSAVLQMGRSMACELAPKGIRVNTLSPGYINTKMTGAFLSQHPDLLKAWSSHNPMGRIGRPDELTGVMLWLASDASTFCTGSDIIVDGGHRAW